MSYQPIRVQRRRTKGWRTPICGCGCGLPARYVGRGSTWGNPWRVGDAVIACTTPAQDGTQRMREFVVNDAIAVALYRQAFELDLLDILTGLRGHDLMCWCPPDRACHADVLIELANGDRHA